MGDIYQLAVKISLDSTAFSTGASGVLRLFNRIQHSAGITGSQIDKLGRSLTTFAAGAALTGVGVVIAGFMDNAIGKAMTLQTILVGVGQTLTNAQGFRLPPRQAAAGAEALRQQAIGLGLTHQMSETDVMRIVQSAMSAGMTTQPVLKGILPGLADFAEVLKLRRGYDPAQSTTVATELAHVFGAWQPALFNQMTNLLGRALAVSPSSPSQFLTLISQFTGAIRPLYGTGPAAKQRLIGDAITTAALESELGQQTRGGTQLARMITQTIGKVGVTAFHATQATGALQQIQRISGMSFFDKGGSFKGVANLIDALAITVRQLHNPQAAGRLFQNAFGAVGARQAGLLGDPTTLARLGVLGNMLGPQGLPTLPSYQQASNASPQGRFNQAQANMNTAMTQLGILWLPIATAGANALAAFTANLIRFTQQHPQMTKLIAGFIAVTAAVALVVGPILMLVGLIGAASVGFEVLGGVVAAIATIGFAPFLVIILAVGAALVGVTLFIMNFGKIMHEFGAGIHNLMVMLGLIKAPPVPTNPLGYHPPASQVQAIQMRHGRYELATKGRWEYQDSYSKWHDDGKYTPPKKGTGGGGAVWDMPLVQKRTQPVWDMPLVQKRTQPVWDMPLVQKRTQPVWDMPLVQKRTQPVWDMPLVQGRNTANGALGGAHQTITLNVHPGAVNVHTAAKDPHAVTKDVAQHLGDELLHTLTSGAPSIFGLVPVLNTPAPR